MNEMCKCWLIQMFESEIDEAKCNLSNQHLWELGYDGEDENPHTQNIEDLKEYIEILENYKKHIEKED